MKIFIMHFANSLLRIFLANIFFLEFLYGILLVLSRCCFHHIVENSILYKKDIQHFYIEPIFFSENKMIQSVVGGKVDSQILFGTRSEKTENFIWHQGWETEKFIWHKVTVTKILFDSQRVNRWNSNIDGYWWLLSHSVGVKLLVLM